MGAVETINYILFDGLYDYVANRNKKAYKEEFTKRKTHSSKFALNFFPKYIDFEKWSKEPKNANDILLINYWIYDVPEVGFKFTPLINTYKWEYEKVIKKNSIKKTYSKDSAINKKNKTKNVNPNKSKLSSDPTAILKLTWDGAISITAKALEAGASLADAVQQGINHLKKSDWYKKLSTQSQKIVDDRFVSDVSRIINKEEKKEKVVEEDAIEKDLLKEKGVFTINESKKKSSSVVIDMVLVYEKNIFAVKLIISSISYYLLTLFLNSIRQTAPLWIVWSLIILQFLIYFSIFILCYRRIKVCGLNKILSLFDFVILAAIGRIQYFGVIIIPIMILFTLIVSASNKKLSPKAESSLNSKDYNEEK